ncbi:MAG TPA: NAD(P)-dependent alcohol dehydrogenase [Ktedonobacterales bacterium]|nr:NAD(P)-dependent alcohol dehydrogenase [Ktedonobacterales bacterium]
MNAVATGERMRAIVHDRYGSPAVLRLDDIPQPTPKDDEVLVKVHATTVNRTDAAVRGGGDLITRLGYSVITTGSPFKALRRPGARILGTELAGVVEAIGAGVTRFAVGERVFGANAGRFGAHAEYVCVRESAPLARMPETMTFAEAAAIPDGAMLALGCLRKVNLQRGQRILIYGAAGAIGSAGVQLAKAFFGARVTAVCSARNIELARSLGADEVIDYTRDDFTKNGQTYHVIFDAVGKHRFRRCKRSLERGGRYIATDGWRNLWLSLWTARVGDKRVMLDIPPHYRQQDLVLLADLVEAGKYRAVIDRRYPMDQVVEATRYVETQRKTGSVVLTVSGDLMV